MGSLALDDPVPRIVLPGALTGDTAGADLTHHDRSPALGYGTTVAGSLPLLTCMGSWGIGGTSGISTGAPLVIPASAASSSPKSASDAESSADCLSPAGAGASRSKNRSSSTGTGMTSVLFFSAATSTT